MVSIVKKPVLFYPAAIMAGILLLPTMLFAQTAQRVENLLGETAISWSTAAAFALEAADVQVFPNPDDAFRYTVERKWLPKKAVAGSQAKLNGVSLLLMRVFKLKGGWFYSMAKNPHYAYRELVYRDIITGRADPEMAVSGDDFLYMVNRILSIKENEKLSQVRKEEERLAREINAQLAAHKVTDTIATVTSEGVTISLSNIQFMPNSTELMEPERVKIREIAQILENIPERNLLVAGHTAMAGTRDEQLRTSRDRAQSVANYLISLGVRTAAEITVQGYGADRPIAPNSTEEGMAQNRRVEITILSGERRG